MSRLRVAVVGVGHLGKEHARILASLPEVELVGVADVNVAQAGTVADRHGTRAFFSYWPLLNLVDAVVIAAPTTQHHALATDFLRRGIPALVEKPLAFTLELAEQLVETARRQSTILQVGHVERFNPAFEELQRRRLQPKFVDVERLGSFTGRSLDIGVVFDLMIHDLDLLLALMPAPVQRVDAVGACFFGGHEDVVNARLTFANGCVANVSASRASTRPVRRMRIWGPEGYAGLNFAERRLTLVQPTEEFRRHGLKVYQAAVAPSGFGNHLESLELDCNRGDQLTRELQHFIHCVRTGTRPRVSGEDGRDAIALATQILQAVQAHQWEGRDDGPVGPAQLPTPLGRLFHPVQTVQAA